MTVPRVSAICIFLDEERFLAEAIDSVLGQDFTEFELLLVDDGSNDGSTRIARDYAARHPGRISYLEHPGHANRGMSASRNLGLTQARGEYVAWLDGDDVWPEAKLREQVELLDAHPDVGMVSGGFTDWRSWAGGKDETWFTGPVSEGKTFPPETTLRVYPLGRSTNPASPMLRRELALAVGGYEEGFPGLYEDQAFLAKVYLACGVYWSRSNWLLYRRHSDACTYRMKWSFYVEWKTRFLDWFSDYIAQRDPPGRAAMERAIRRKRRELRHRYLAFARRRMRRYSLAALRLVGFDDLYRRYRHGGG